MWLALAFISAALLGFYETSKKAAVSGNAVLSVLWLTTLFSTLILSPMLIDSIVGRDWFSGTVFHGDPLTGHALLKAHLLALLKAVIVLISWISGYYGLKHLPITIVGPINATSPVFTLIGAMIIFGERLNGFQWSGVVLTVISLLLLSRSSRRENVDFAHNRWIWLIAFSTVMNAVSGLYDKFIMQSLSAAFVQSWYNFYQLVIMSVLTLAIWLPQSRRSARPRSHEDSKSEDGGRKERMTGFHWSRAILLISVFISAADFIYFTALSQPDAMISVVSLVRRGQVIVSFICGALIFKEHNLKAKALDLSLTVLGMLLIWLGSK